MQLHGKEMHQGKVLSLQAGSAYSIQGNARPNDAIGMYGRQKTRNERNSVKESDRLEKRLATVVAQVTEIHPTRNRRYPSFWYQMKYDVLDCSMKVVIRVASKMHCTPLCAPLKTFHSLAVKLRVMRERIVRCAG